jgi:hypothetical protein
MEFQDRNAQMICFTVDCGLTGYKFETGWQRVRRQRSQLFCAARICDSNLRRIVLTNPKRFSILGDAKRI